MSDVTEQRRQLRAQYQGLYDQVLAILFRHDLVGINYGHNTDEYDPEVRTILPRLAQAASVEDVHRIVDEEFLRWFGDAFDHRRRDQAKLQEIAEQIWQAEQRHRIEPVPVGLDRNDRQEAEMLLGGVCVERLITGVDFGFSMQIRLRDGNNDSQIMLSPDQVAYLNLGQRWAVLPSLPDAFSDPATWPRMPVADQLASLYELRQDLIVDVRLDEQLPHVAISFESGRALIANGYSEDDSCWYLGVKYGEAADIWCVAGPGALLFVTPPPQIMAALKEGA